MSKIALHLPPVVKVIGSLRTRDKRQNLNQDMLCLELPGRVFIDVGWHPDWNPNGEYRLVVFRDAYDQVLEKPLCTKDVHKIQAAIYRMVSKYLPSIPIHSRGNVFANVYLNCRSVAPPKKQIASISTAAAHIMSVTG